MSGNSNLTAEDNAHLDKLQRSLRGEPLEILTAVRERDADAARRHMAQHGYRFAATLDASALAAALSARRVSPLTVTVDRAGRLLQVMHRREAPTRR